MAMPPRKKLRKCEALLLDGNIGRGYGADCAISSAYRRWPLCAPDVQSATKKTKTLEALARHLINRTQEQPVLMLFDDTHWVDPSSLELLDNVVGLLTGLPILLVTSFRPEFQRLGSATQA